MPIKVTPELRAALPEPDAKGIVRATAGMRVKGDIAEIVEINDVPVDYANDKSDDDEPMPERSLPDLNAAEDQIYGG